MGYCPEAGSFMAGILRPEAAFGDTNRHPGTLLYQHRLLLSSPNRSVFMACPCDCLDMPVICAATATENREVG
jgi:hypothetical protein